MKVLLLLNRLLCFEDCVTFFDHVLTKVTKVLIILSIVKRNRRLAVYLHQLINSSYVCCTRERSSCSYAIKPLDMPQRMIKNQKVCMPLPVFSRKAIFFH